jgi:membrane protease YdiL (CAAX protease family)
MIPKFSPFSRFLFFLFLISLLSAKVALLGVSTQFYLGEFSGDVKILLFVLLLFMFIRKYHWDFGLNKYGILRWDVGQNILAFLSPLVILAPTIIAGYLLKKTTFEGADDSVTLLLATLFDIPAAYFFPIAVVLVEEFIFRGFIFDFLSRENGIFRSVLISLIIWTVANFDKIAQIRSSSLFVISSELLNLISIGLACSAIYCHTKSIWPGYSFRIGLLVFSSAMLASDANETSGVFHTETHALSNSGILFSFVTLTFASCLIIFSKSTKKPRTSASFPLF